MFDKLLVLLDVVNVWLYLTENFPLIWPVKRRLSNYFLNWRALTLFWFQLKLVVKAYNCILKLYLQVLKILVKIFILLRQNNLLDQMMSAGDLLFENRCRALCAHWWKSNWRLDLWKSTCVSIWKYVQICRWFIWPQLGVLKKRFLWWPSSPLWRTSFTDHVQFRLFSFLFLLFDYNLRLFFWNIALVTRLRHHS